MYGSTGMDTIQAEGALTHEPSSFIRGSSSWVSLKWPTCKQAGIVSGA